MFFTARVRVGCQARLGLGEDHERHEIVLECGHLLDPRHIVLCCLLVVILPLLLGLLLLLLLLLVLLCSQRRRSDNDL